LAFGRFFRAFELPEAKSQKLLIVSFWLVGVFFFGFWKVSKLRFKSFQEAERNGA
jgi:predicted permease